MRKKLAVLPVLFGLVPTLCVACNVTNSDDICLGKRSVVQESFGGLGVEWGAYEDTEKLRTDAADVIYKNADHLSISRARVMVNYDWFVSGFDNHLTTDKTKHTWNYNFTNKWAKSTFDILTYCQEHNIEVAFGAWNIVGNGDASDPWQMTQQVSSDIRWAKMTADVLSFLVNEKGFNCIKWFVNTNEPNYYAGKNALNSYEKWEQGVKNVREYLDKAGLSDIGIVGGDVTILNNDSAQQYLLNISKNITDNVSDYGIHVYARNSDLTKGGLYHTLKDFAGEIKKNDKEAGKARPFNVWECGLKDGKNDETDGNSLIATEYYGVTMCDFTIQASLAGVNGITYWDFDDAMHFMYLSSGNVAKRWGMFSSLADDNPTMQERRPWYHSSTLLINLLKKGNAIYTHKVNEIDDTTFRVLGTSNENGSQAGIVAINRGSSPVTKKLSLGRETIGEKLFVYEFGSNKYLLDAEGFVKPNYVIDGSLNNKTEITIGGGSFVVLSNTRL